MSDNVNRPLPRIPAMLQVTARAKHEAGHPPPDGLVFDEVLGVYVIDPEKLTDLQGRTDQ